MLSFEKPLSSTETQRTRLEQGHDFFSIPPARRVPAEILEKIFSIICLPEFDGYSLDIDEYREEKTIASVAPTLALSQVSSLRRQTAKGFPELWSSIKVRLSDFTVVGLGAEPLLGLYLTRSQEHPLDLKFVYLAPHRDPSIRDILSPHLRRVVKVDISDAKRVSIVIPEWLADGLSNATRVTELKLDHDHLRYVHAPYHQLTSLQIINVTTEPLIPMLGWCTNLRTLQLTVLSGVFFSSFDHCQLRHLQHLSLSCPGPYKSHFTWHIDHLTLPSLVSLEISLSSLGSFAEVLALIHRSSCRLSQLVLKTSEMFVPNAELTEFFWACPELSRLRVHILKDASKKKRPEEKKCLETFTYQLLDVLSHSPMAAPKLVDLSVLEVEPIDSESANTLLGMLETRMRALDVGWVGEPVPSLRWDLRFGRLSTCTADVLRAFNARLEKLVENGFACSIEWAETVI